MLNHAHLSDFLKRPEPVARLVITDVRGSSPREVGAEMFVRANGLHGTIGGGQAEYRAIEAARNMLAGHHLSDRIEIRLGPEIGQCCGGRITVDLKRMTAADIDAALERAAYEMACYAEVYVLGAGHVGRALANLLQHMPVRTILIDPRLDELAMNRAAVETRNSVLPEVDIAAANPGSAFVVLTHDHGLDFLLASAALSRGDAAYVGMIGSVTKRAKLASWARGQSDALQLDDLVCPIGTGGSRDKRPAVIAAFVAAEVMARLTGDMHSQRNSHEALPLYAAE
ncbi:xanthine dehydrogenase accessory protein XdhC [Paracoccus albus]|uniref:xanthine dehydrogenase accessory protein XdhC n=1 Tax=Paracoccus albus TaxID=3017784 RepID=UPI0022EFF3EB|nr:xanthine dehydrogenase accessory protein XdhC [Paracoccus albus]WBU58854.1 xanthine dehydrogenase accessory protein XdhC [Paracoccus albus]